MDHLAGADTWFAHDIGIFLRQAPSNWRAWCSEKSMNSVEIFLRNKWDFKRTSSFDPAEFLVAFSRKRILVKFRFEAENENKTEFSVHLFIKNYFKEKCNNTLKNPDDLFFKAIFF